MRRLGAIALLLAAATLAAAAGFAPAAVAQDASELVVRLNRLEGQVRGMSGQIEQLGFENRQLKDQVRKFQEDVEFRFGERSGGGRSPSAAPSNPPPASTGRPARRSDAFDPADVPDAPGAPRQLGSAAPSPALGPADRGRPADSAFSEGGSAPLDINAAARGAPSAPSQARAEPSLPPGSQDARADYDVAYAYVIQKQPAEAEAAFRRFVSAHPRDRLVPDALYWLGESYAGRGRHKEAAEQFLKVSTDHARSAKAPDALYRLGAALAALGAKDQACATLAQVELKYPAASAGVKQGVDREQKRARCPA